MLTPRAAARIRGFTPYRAAARLPNLAAVKTKTLFFRILPAAVLALAGPLRGAEAAAKPAAESRFEVPVARSGDARLEGVLAKREFSFRLPEHVRYEPGSELLLDYRCSPLLLEGSTLTVSINGRQVASARLGHAERQPDIQESSRLAVPVPEGVLRPGWNRMEVRCLLQTTRALCRDVDNPAAWLEFSPGTALRVAYSDQPLFAEIQRFPESIAEPVLMRLPDFQDPSPKNPPEPAVSLLLPWEAGDPELRTLLIAAARLGQTVYTPSDAVRVGELTDYAEESTKRNGLLIGVREDLAALPLPGHVKKALAELEPGEGLLAEVINGPPNGVQRRWIVLGGTDGPGLENAALVLGNSAALRGVCSNPWIVSKAPAVSPVLERAAQPAVGPLKLGTLPDGEILLRGLFRNTATRQVAFPPGFETSGSGYVDFDLSHSGDLEKTSALEVRLNDTVIGSVSLAPGDTGPVRQRLRIPEGIAGRDPSVLTVSSYLDIGSVDCGHRHEERAWLRLGPDSLLDLQTEAFRIEDLSQLNQIPLRDAFLRRAAVLVPGEAESRRNDLLKTVGMRLGGRLPSMPVLWPQVATYASDRAPDPARVGNRSGLVLGSADQWNSAFEGKCRLVVEGAPGRLDRLVLRGEEVPKSDFDPSLVFAQLVASPWTNGEYFAAIGGIGGLGGNTTVDLLDRPDIFERLGGTVSALDGSGRLVTYDVRSVQEMSLAAQVRSAFEPGVESGDIVDREIRKTEAGMAATALNLGLGSAAVLVLAGLFVLQRIAVRRRKPRIEEGDEL